MTITEGTSPSPGRVLDPVLILALLKFAFHVAVVAAGGYGYFRDELYYIICSERLDWGYVDHPPFSIAILALSRSFLGDSLVALRLVPAVVGAATVYLAGQTARELGGGIFARVLTAIATLCAPILLGMNSVYSMNSFDFLVWIGAAYLFVRILRSSSTGLWVALGIVLGIGLLNKVGVLWLGAGVAVSLIIHPLRSEIRTRGPWLAAGIALVIFLPFVLWNIAHGFPHIEFIRNATGEKYASLTAWTFITDQIILQNPLSFPLWIAGLWYLLFGPGKNFRPLGILYLVAFTILIVNQHSKGEYLAPAYPMLFAGGAVWMEGRITRGLWRKVIVGVVVASGVVLAPLAAPLLPVDRFISYANALGIAPSNAEGKQLAELPQFYADMFGWEELTDAVHSVYDALPPEERADCLIYTQNYGEASAINFFGKRRGLPPAVTGHNNYYLWGPGRESVRVVLILGGRREDHLRGFADVVEVGRTMCRYCMPYENDLPIFRATSLRAPLSELWPLTKHYE